MQDHDDEDLSQPQHEQPTPHPDEAEGLRGGVTHRRRVRPLALGTALIAFAVLGTAIAISGGGSSANPASRRDRAATHEIRNLLAGIPQSGNTLGSPTAPVTLQYFGDLECTTARIFTLQDLPTIIREWVRPGKMRIEFRSLRTVSPSNAFSNQQIAALAAGRQDKLWYYIENFYRAQGHEHSGYVTEDYLSTLARHVPGLNLEQWRRDRHEPQLAAQVSKDEQAAHAAYLNQTPSLLIGRTGSHSFRRTPRFAVANLSPFNESVRETINN
jgi:protein-disulfide isomerase